MPPWEVLPVCFELRKVQFRVEGSSHCVETDIGLHEDEVKVGVEFLLAIGDGRAEKFAAVCALACSAVECS
jgi:hypothetical protein